MESCPSQGQMEEAQEKKYCQKKSGSHQKCTFKVVSIRWHRSNSCKHYKGRWFTRGEDMGISARNSHQGTKEIDHHTEQKCEKISPLGDMFSPIHSTPMFVDGMHPYLILAFLFTKVLMVNLFQML